MADDLKDKLARLYHRAAEGKLTAREQAQLRALVEDGGPPSDVKAKAAAIIAERFPQPAAAE